MTCTIALRSRVNNRNSLRYSGSFPKRGGPFLPADGPASDAAKLPLSPCCVPHTLNHTAPAAVIPATNQQVIMPSRNENEPSDCPPRNSRSHGQGTIVKTSRNLAI